VAALRAAILTRMGPVLLLSSLLAAPPGAPAATLSQPLVYRIKRHERGGYVYDATTFQASIADDGAVRFRDDHGVFDLLWIAAPQPLPEGTPTLEGSIRKVLGHVRRRNPAAPPPPAPRAAAPQTPGGAVLEICERRPCVDPQRVVGFLGATFDITDEVMRLHGDDPYHAQKARFLADTAEWRHSLATAQRDRRKDAALTRQQDQLKVVWKQRQLSVPERRRLLFNLWLEMDQASPEGRQGAAGVLAFIRKHLPAGSPDAFTAHELRDMNQAAAPQRFDPYGP
jgi:hypothetical protein